MHHTYQIIKGIFHRIRTKNSTFCMETQKAQIVKEILRKKNGTREIWPPDFRQSYSNPNSTIPAQKQKYRPMEQEKSPEINACIYSHLIYDKGGKNIQWRKDNLYNKWCWENWATTYKRMKLEHSLTPYTKTNLGRLPW